MLNMRLSLQAALCHSLKNIPQRLQIMKKRFFLTKKPRLTLRVKRGFISGVSGG